MLTLNFFSGARLNAFCNFESIIDFSTRRSFWVGKDSFVRVPDCTTVPSSVYNSGASCSKPV